MQCRAPGTFVGAKKAPRLWCLSKDSFLARIVHEAVSCMGVAGIRLFQRLHLRRHIRSAADPV